ncbi:MAG TPA: transglycosylase domain-containing protein [Galbitalea sp.]|jgi:membrane peptidoglycan carboxypeptidase|nr:transglycosylase domain-containing protein [Galbitalea sp.]
MSAQNPPRGPLFSAVLGFIAFSAVAGLLVVAMMTPGIAITSVTAKSAIGIFNNLPTYISIGTLPGPNTIYAQDGTNPDGSVKEVPVATIFDENRQQVAWNKISAAAKNAAVDGEDRRFYSHGGVDVTGIIRAALAGLGASSGGQQGASTIAQQLVKNLFIQEALQAPTLKKQTQGIKDAEALTLDRKLKEAKLAISLEKKYTKKQILLAYLNIAPFGGTTYGIEAAAQRYYGISASQLNNVQAATLMAIVQNPNQKAPTGTAGYASNTSRRDDILGQMLGAKHITQAQYNAGVKVKESSKTIENIPPKQGCSAAIANTGFWCAYISQLYKTVPSFGTTLAQREKNWKLGGYKIYTSLNLALQDDAQLIEHEWVPSYLPTMDIGGSTVSVQVGTGRILVMAENRTFNQSLKGGGRGTTAINYAVDQKYGGSAYGFQGGSTYKPFTLINWLQHGHGLEDVLNATPDPNLDLSRFKDRCEPGGWGGKYGRYTNDEGEKGPFTVLRATAQSVNGIFLQMGAQLDQCDTRDDAEAFGVHQGHTGLALQHQPSAILGTNSVAPLTMAAAYAGIANHGVFCKPTAIDSVVAPDGKALAGQAKSCSVAISPDLDAAVGYAMEGVFSAGTAGAARPPGVNILGKTGTTNNSVQTWTVGATTKVATAVWIGNATGQVAARRTLPPRQCPGTADQVATLRNCVFKYTMESIDAAKGYAPGSFPTAPAQYLNGNTKPLPDFAGQTVNSATAQLQALNFTVTVHSGMVHSAQPAGTVAYTDPSAGTKISSGYQVTIYVSDGSETMTIPDVTGESWFQASNDIESAGFVPPQEVCTATLNPGQEGKVLSTDPIAGWQGPGATVIKVDVGQFGADPCP